MDEHTSFKPKFSDYIILMVQGRLFFVLKWPVLFISLFILPFMEAKAQYAYIPDKEDAVLTYDDLLVTTYAASNWSFNTHMIVSNSNLLYIHVEDLFKNLEIQCTVSSDGNKIDGFIENASKTYAIDFNAKQIKVGNKIIPVKQELISESGALYLESTVMAKAFGINVTFNPRSLSAKLTCDFELPKIKQLRLEKTRQNVSALRGEPLAADTVVKRDYHLFKFGTIDWGMAFYQTLNEQSNKTVRLGVGAELLYGEVNVSAYYDNSYQFDKRQLQYSWRWIDNDVKLIRQAQVGNIYNQTISSVNFPVIGASIRNSPTTVRKASGNYTINEYTEPNWTVELYINDVLVNYTVADASGLFVFKVPIVYGYTTLKLKFYGPLGEERTEERTMNMPFTFVPVNTFEYGLSGGVLQDGDHSRFGLADFNYGVNRFLTVGGGLEYLSSIPFNPYIPFARLFFIPFSKLILNLEYAHGVRMQGLLNYYFNQSAYLQIDYAKYVEGQFATQFKALEERKVLVSVPLKIKKVSGLAKLSFNQNVYLPFTYNQFNFLFSLYYKQFSVNSSSMINWVSNNPSYSITDLSLSYRMKNGLVFRPSAQYSLKDDKLVIARAELEKRLSKMYFSVSYERNVYTQSNNVYLSFRYDLPFARTDVSGSYSNNKFRFSEAAQGSLSFGDESHVVKTGYNSALGKGGILFYPFLDLNQNGILDKGEKMVLLTRVKVSGGSAKISEADSIVRVADLNAFVDYNVEFTDLDFDNIAWRFKHKKYQVLVDPNQYKHVYVPIVSVGEVSGMIYLAKNNTLDGINRIIVKFYKKNGTKAVAETLSESDGYIYYLGLEPGEYVARIDSTQLNNLNYKADPLQKEFTIRATEQGDTADGINFVLRPKMDEPMNLKNKEKELNIEAPANSIKELPVEINKVTPGEQKNPVPPDNNRLNR